MRVFILNKKQLCLLFCIVISMVFGLIIGGNATLKSSATEKRLLPIYNVQTEEKKIALTFDVAWGNSDLDQILNILKDHNAKATFFVTGQWSDHYPGEVQKLIASGHDVQNHSDAHPHVASIGTQQLLSDTQACDSKLEKLIGKRPIYYRAPYGEYDNEMISTLSDYQVIQWNIDSRDWKLDATVESIVNNVSSKIESGSIVLFHVDAKPKCTPQALEKIFTKMSDQYECVLLPDLLIQGEYTINPNGTMIAK